MSAPRPQDITLAQLFGLLCQRDLLRRRLAAIERRLRILRRKHGLTPESTGIPPVNEP